MATILNTNSTRNLRQASGEELLMLAVFGSPGLKPRIDQELDRRALSDIAGGQGVVPQPSSTFSGYAA